MTSRIQLKALEVEIIRHLADGLNTTETAAVMRMEPSSIETYRTRLLKKLHRKNSCHLVAWAFRRGLFDPRVPQNSAVVVDVEEMEEA
jgi:DNA-binding CsgD family transcriptional regulator